MPSNGHLRLRVPRIPLQVRIDTANAMVDVLNGEATTRIDMRRIDGGAAP